jgi:CTP synthase
MEELILCQIACRCDVPLEKGTIEKVAMFCQVEPQQVVAVHNVSSTYHVPLLLEKQGLVQTIRDILNLDNVPKAKSLVDRGQRTWVEWKNLTSSQDRLFESVKIALVGKYTNLHDSYLSVIKSLEHSAMRCGKKLELIWVDASNLEDQAKTDNPAEFHKAWHAVCTADGILVPGGFGHRGTEGMIQAAKWARTNKTPYLGICLGMQIAVVEFARHVCDIPHAGSVELHEQCPDPVVIFMPEIDKTTLGGTMRLGLRPTLFQDGSEWSRLRQLYGEKKEIHERHRHRYEVNPDYIDRLTKGGLEFIGKDDKGVRMEILELKDHPWYVGVQFHPEYLSRVLMPSKPYLGFVAAACGCLDRVTADIVRGEMVNGVHEYVEGTITNGLNGVRI